MDEITKVFNLLQTVMPITNSFDFTMFGSFYCMLLEEWCLNNNENIIECIDIIQTQINLINKDLGDYSLSN